jgi:transposase InsO family protein
MQAEHSILELCAALDVSRSGYHAWVARAPGPRTRANAALWPLIEQAFEESRQTYGSPRIRQWLGRQGQKCSRHRVARLMRSHRMASQTKRRFRVALTDSNHDLPIAPNRLRGTPVPARRDAVWVADITYVDTDEGWLYVAGVLDRHTRRCVGWAMDDTLATSLPLAALDMALQHRRPAAGLVHHSDRGVQYASAAYRQRLAAAGAQPSMSRRGNCYDNAAMESFWSSLKRELVHRARYATRAEARAAVFEWIEIFYNRERLHSALGFQSPVDFEKQLN